MTVGGILTVESLNVLEPREYSISRDFMKEVSSIPVALGTTWFFPHMFKRSPKELQIQSKFKLL